MELMSLKSEYYLFLLADTPLASRDSGIKGVRMGIINSLKPSLKGIIQSAL